jgi:hypothetical protein
LARRSLKPQLNQIRTWVRQGRTDAWIAHQLDVSVGDIRSFKRDHDLAPETSDAEGENSVGGEFDEPDLRAEDDALVAAALEAEAEEEDEADEDQAEPDADAEVDAEDDDNGDKPRKRRRGRRGGRGRRKRPGALEGTFDHGEEGYGLWLDPAVQDDPVYAEHWAGHRPVTVVVEPERIVITRTGEEDPVA